MSDTQATSDAALSNPPVTEAAYTSAPFSPATPGSLTEAELRRRLIDEFFAIADQLAATAPPLSDEEVAAEIEAEIEAARAERRARNARGD